MAKLNTYLHFNGKTKEAMTFYKECLGGELTLTTMGESPMGAQMPQEAKDNIMHSALNADGIALMASDMRGGDQVKGNTMSLSLNCKSVDEAKTLFAKLSAGGKVTQELMEVPFGTFGDFTDKFGIDWMVQADPEPKA